MSTDRPFFATPQDAEAAFYDALERADLEAMMAVWSEDEEIVCIHPGGPRLAGYAAVRESWRMIFRNGSRLRVATSGLQATQGMLLAVHNLHEQLSLVGEGEATQTVLATNVYQRGADGWRMVLHHTAPAPDAADPADPLPDVPATLH
jgi:ketosteroid isomerase-like protein